jgi:flagellin-like protein
MRKDEKGVSPVIGVILMVAVTVILAAVVWTFVNTYASTKIIKAPSAALQAVGGKGEITIKHLGGEPIKCDELEIKIDDTPESFECSENYFSVGDVLTFSDVSSGVRTVTVIHVPTGTVLLDTTVKVL